MSEVVFLFTWTAFFALMAFFTWKATHKHIKVYLMMFYSFLYLTGVFYFFDKL